MKFFSKFKQPSASDRLMEEQLYSGVLNEIQSGIKREGLWAKAIAKSGGSESKAKSLYIEFRVQSMKDDLELANELIDIEKAKEAQQKEEEQKAIKIAEEKKQELKRLKIKKEQQRIKELKKLAKITGNEYTES
jgi:hypothetical protein